MIKEFLEKWWKYKDNMESYFRGFEDISGVEYHGIVKALVENILNQGVEWCKLSKEVKVIDDGDYEGTMIFIFHNDTCTPSITDYFFTHNYYGSCSGCDTLLSIVEGSGGKATDEQVKLLMRLAFDLLRNIKPMAADAQYDYEEIHLTEGEDDCKS